MKALRIENDEMLCRYENALFLENDSCSIILGDSEKGYSIQEPVSIDSLIQKDKDGWTTLSPLHEAKDEKFTVIAGETSWGGAGFVALKNSTDNSFKWVIHLSNMNNPSKVIIKDEIVYVTTDLNFPDGVEFVIPLHKPGSFEIKYDFSDE